MRYTFLINQAGVVRCGLLGRITLAALCILDYIQGWFFCRKAKRAIVNGNEYVWLQYEHAVEELPLLFNPQAAVKTRKNQLSRLVTELRDVGLVKSVRVGRDLYLRPSDLAANLANSRERTVTKSDPTLTRTCDDSLTPTCDDPNPPNNIEQTIKETTSNKAPPVVPPKGDRVGGNGSSSIDVQAEEIYAAYPRKVGKPAALRAIRRAIGRHDFNHILARTQAYANARAGDLAYMPNPSTFFNQDRFNDDPGTWRRASPVNGKSTPKIISDQFGQGVSKL